MTSGTPAVPDVAVFVVSGHPVTASDVLASLPADELQGLRLRTAQGQGARERQEIDDASRREAEKSFRHRRRLVSAEEMEAWLTTWHLDVTGWRGQVRRDVARERDLALGHTPATADVGPEDLWAALVVDGTLEEAAGRLARRMAAAVASGLEPTEGDDDTVEQWLAEAVPATQVDRELAERGLDWTRVAWELLSADTEDAALEARLCLADDGTPSDRIGDLLGHPVERGDAWLHEAPPDLRDPLLGVAAGETSPPLPRDDGWRLLHVLRRSRPDPDDQEVRAAVRAHLAEQALDLEVRDRVVWHVTF